MALQTRLPSAPVGYSTVNPFIITDDADGLARFLTDGFGARERAEARTIDNDGLLLHAELVIGDTTVMLADRKPDWPFTPSLLQVYVDDLDATLEAARNLGATIVTEPTEFFGDVFSRFRDPWSNLWWVYRHRPQVEDPAAESSWTDDAAGADGEGWDGASPELEYIHDTLLSALAGIGDPRRQGSAR